MYHLYSAKFSKIVVTNKVFKLFLGDDFENSAVKLLFQILCVHPKRKGDFADFLMEYDVH